MAVKLIAMPKRIYVHHHKAKDEDWFEADPEIDGFEDGDTIGVYELKETKRKTTVHSLE